MKKILLIPLLNILSLPVFSRIYGKLTKISFPRFLIIRVIRYFKRRYKIDMGTYKGNESDYRSLAEFFVRPLDPEKRKLPTDPEYLLSPADGRLVSIDTVQSDTTTLVKGRDYSVSEFLQEEIDFNQKWHIATIYLSPQNYHRYHFSSDSKLCGYIHKRGALFPVNHLGVNFIKRLFTRNERVVCKFKQKDRDYYVAAVGATFVGSIKMTFIPKIKRDNRWVNLDREIRQMAEMGRFELGSTIVMAVPDSLASPLLEKVDSSIQTGDTLFKLK